MHELAVPPLPGPGPAHITRAPARARAPRAYVHAAAQDSEGGVHRAVCMLRMGRPRTKRKMGGFGVFR